MHNLINKIFLSCFYTQLKVVYNKRFTTFHIKTKMKYPSLSSFSPREGACHWKTFQKCSAGGTTAVTKMWAGPSKIPHPLLDGHLSHGCHLVPDDTSHNKQLSPTKEIVLGWRPTSNHFLGMPHPAVRLRLPKKWRTLQKNLLLFHLLLLCFVLCYLRVTTLASFNQICPPHKRELGNSKSEIRPSNSY